MPETLPLSPGGNSPSFECRLLPELRRSIVYFVSGQLLVSIATACIIGKPDWDNVCSPGIDLSWGRLPAAKIQQLTEGCIVRSKHTALLLLATLDATGSTVCLVIPLLRRWLTVEKVDPVPVYPTDDWEREVGIASPRRRISAGIFSWLSWLKIRIPPVEGKLLRKQERTQGCRGGFEDNGLRTEEGSNSSVVLWASAAAFSKVIGQSLRVYSQVNVNVSLLMASMRSDLLVMLAALLLYVRKKRCALPFFQIFLYSGLTALQFMGSFADLQCLAMNAFHPALFYIDSFRLMMRTEDVLAHTEPIDRLESAPVVTGWRDRWGLFAPWLCGFLNFFCLFSSKRVLRSFSVPVVAGWNGLISLCVFLLWLSIRETRCGRFISGASGRVRGVTIPVSTVLRPPPVEGGSTASVSTLVEIVAPQGRQFFKDNPQQGNLPFILSQDLAARLSTSGFHAESVGKRNDVYVKQDVPERRHSLVQQGIIASKEEVENLLLGVRPFRNVCDFIFLYLTVLGGGWIKAVGLTSFLHLCDLGEPTSDRSDSSLKTVGKLEIEDFVRFPQTSTAHVCLKEPEPSRRASWPFKDEVSQQTESISRGLGQTRPSQCGIFAYTLLASILSSWPGKFGPACIDRCRPRSYRVQTGFGTAAEAGGELHMSSRKRSPEIGIEYIVSVRACEFGRNLHLSHAVEEEEHFFQSARGSNCCRV